MFFWIFRDSEKCETHCFHRCSQLDLRFLESFKRVKEDGEREDDLYYVEQAKAFGGRATSGAADCGSKGLKRLKLDPRHPERP